MPPAHNELRLSGGAATFDSILSESCQAATDSLTNAAGTRPRPAFVGLHAGIDVRDGAGYYDNEQQRIYRASFGLTGLGAGLIRRLPIRYTVDVFAYAGFYRTQERSSAPENLSVMGIGCQVDASMIFVHTPAVSLGLGERCVVAHEWGRFRDLWSSPRVALPVLGLGLYCAFEFPLDSNARLGARCGFDMPGTRYAGMSFSTGELSVWVTGATGPSAAAVHSGSITLGFSLCFAGRNFSGSPPTL